MSHNSDSEAVEQVLASLHVGDTNLGSGDDLTPERDQVEELLKRLEAESFSSQEHEPVSMALDDDDDPDITINIKPEHVYKEPAIQHQPTPIKPKPETPPPKTYNTEEVESTNASTISASDELSNSKPISSPPLTRIPLKDLSGIPESTTANGKHPTAVKRESSTSDAKSFSTTSSTTTKKSTPPKEQPPKPWKLKSQPKLQPTDDIVFAVATPPSEAPHPDNHDTVPAQVDTTPVVVVSEPPAAVSEPSKPVVVSEPPAAVSEPPAAVSEPPKQLKVEDAPRVIPEEKPVAPKSPILSVNTNKQPIETNTIDTSSASVDHSQLVDTIRREVTQQLAQEIGVLEMEFSELKVKYDREVRGNNSLKSALYEYEQTIKKLIEGAGMAAKDEALAERVATLEAENRRKASEAEAMEISFNDLKARYEEMKLLNEKLKTNEQMLKDTIQRQNTDLQTQESRFDKLKMHAETKLDSASERLAQVKSDAAREVALIAAKLQKAEARITQVEEQLQDKEEKNRELLVICDDLLAKIEK